ncbi:MAG: hypothetical protein IPH52_14330 [Leptospiraceae bacterium]|nr:hypothetical protein [Leptospiraceae bacterium]
MNVSKVFIWKENAEDCYRDNNLPGSLDILLVDIGLPDMSGIDLIQVSQKLPALKMPASHLRYFIR